MPRPSLPHLIRLARYARLSADLFEGTPCVLWTGATADGYGRYEYRANGRRKKTSPHRVAWETIMGEKIPDGLTIDHRCKVKTCLNVAHLEIVTAEENARRGDGRPSVRGAQQAAKTHCPAGHPYDEQNTIHRTGPKGQPWRQCRACKNRPKVS